MRFLNSILFILFNIYLIESANRTDSVGEISDSVREKSDNLEEVLYEEYDYDDGKRENSISEKVEKSKGNSTEAEDSRDSFPNEVFLSLRNITADAATAFRSFTHRNDVADLQASASDNLNVTTNATLGDAESAGINLRALRDAGHPPVIIEESLGAVHLPFKHAKIDTADLSDCALQGEWKPMGVAHGHLQVGGDHSQQTEILQSVGSYAVPNKVIPQWGQNQVLGEQLIQDVGHNHKPFSGGGGHAYASGYGSGGFGGSGGHNYGGSNAGHSSGFGSGGGFGGSSSGHAYASGFGSGSGSGGSAGHSYASGFGGNTGGHAYASGFNGNLKGSGGGFGGSIGGHGHGSGSGFGGGSGGHAHSHSSFGSGSGYSGSGGGGHAYASGYGGHIGIASNHQTVGFSGGHKIKPSMLSPPPVPPIIFGKKPGYWKIPKSKPKYVYSKNKRPSGSYEFSSYVNHAPVYGGVSNQGGSGYKGSLGGLGSSGVSGYVNGGYGNAGGSAYMSGGYGNAGGSGYESGGHGSAGDSGSLGQIKYVYGGASGSLKHPSGGVSALSSGDYGGASTQVLSHGAATTGDLGHGGGGGGGGAGGGLSLSGDHGTAIALSGGQDDRPTVGHLIADHNAGAEGLSSGGHSESSGYGQGTGGDHLIAASTLGSADDLSAHLAQSGNGGIAQIVTLNHGGSLLPEAYFSSSTGSQIHDSTFSSTHLTQSGGSQLPGAGYLSSQNFAVHGQGILDDLSSSSTFTCGKNHDHNTNYHTATFQVADHDHPSSVDVLQYGGDAAVLIQSGGAPFHDQILPERKQYNSVHLSDAEASGSDNTNELASQAALTSQTAEEDGGQTDTELTKTDDGEEPERHSYYHEITKVTKIPLTSVGSIQKFYSQYETKPQTFTTETETTQEEEAEQPQIIKELEHLSNKFQLDLENPQKLFEDPPNQELAYHYPFQGEQEGGKVEGVKEGGQEGVTDFPYKFYQSINQQPIVHHKRPPIKYIPRPGKVPYEKPINYIHPKPVVVVRKHKPKQFLKKQNYEVVEHGEKHRPIGEIFPPQKFPKQFHNPKPNFAVDRPKKTWRPEYEEYKYDFSHGKKIRKLKTKAKVVAPIIIRRPVSPAPVLRVVQVSG